MTVNIELYEEGVVALAQLAFSQDGTSGSVAAQVLLSTYNDSNYQLACVDLASLDGVYREHAKNVIFGRIDNFQEPHKLIEGGDEVFDRLQDCWSELHVTERYAPYYKKG